MNKKNEVLFQEVQRFCHSRLFLIVFLTVAFACLFALFFSVRDCINIMNDAERTFTSDQWVGIPAVVLALFVVLGLLFGGKMVTEVRANGLFLKYIPFIWKFYKIDLKEVKSIEAVTYRPIAEYGGWGIRWAFFNWKKKVYNMYGNQGVIIQYRDEKSLLIGSQRANELKAAIEKIT